MKKTSIRIVRVGLLIVTSLVLWLDGGVARAGACYPHNSGNISTLSCFQSHVCTNQADACYVSNPNGCAGTVNANTTCNPTPSDLQVTFWQDADYQGGCITFEVPANLGALSVPYLGTWGFNDCITSLKVGAKVRLHAYKDASQGSGGSFYSASANGGIVYWKATYEPGPQSNIGTYGADQDSFSSLVIENRSLLANREPIPYTYRGDYPSNKQTLWSEEAQGLCHNKDYWFITKEAYLPTSIAYPNPFALPCPSPYVPMDGHCVNPYYIDASSTCILDDHRYTGRVYRWPLETDIWQEQDPTAEPPGVTHRDQSDFNFLTGGTSTPSTKLGYRHFGDPDCMTIQGKDYVFIPVERCGNQAPGVLLVLDSNLNYVATWTVPTSATMTNGTLGWVALRPGTEAAPEVWVSGDIWAGKGLRRLQGKLCSGVPCDGITLDYKNDLLLRSLQGKPEDFPNVSGGVFSPSGKTLYLTRGASGGGYGGVHAIDPTSGQTLADSGSVDDGYCYGPFCYGANVSVRGDEPEGMDFLDTRCTDKIIPGITVGKESQLHVFLLNNNYGDTLDNIRVKHYSINGASNAAGEWGTSGLPLMCNPGSDGGGAGNRSSWNLGPVGTTTQTYPYAFNVFAFGNVSGLQDVQGPVAAGGTVSLSSFNVNWNKALPIGLVSNGKLTLSNGTIHGTTYYGGDRSLNGATFDGSTISGRPIDFSTARVKLRAMSRMLQSYPGNGTVALSYSNLTLTGNNTNLNTFDSNAFTLGRAHSITLSVPAGSMVVINIDGQDVQFGNAGVVVNGLDQHNIIWNFPQAAKISMTSIGLPGSVLAPDADVSLTSGNINGTLVANSVTSTGEFHYVPFQYNMLPP